MYNIAHRQRAWSDPTCLSWARKCAFGVWTNPKSTIIQIEGGTYIISELYDHFLQFQNIDSWSLIPEKLMILDIQNLLFIN